MTIANKEIKATYWSLIIIYFALLITKHEGLMMWIILAAIFSFQALDVIIWKINKRRAKK